MSVWAAVKAIIPLKWHSTPPLSMFMDLVETRACDRRKVESYTRLLYSMSFNHGLYIKLKA